MRIGIKFCGGCNPRYDRGSCVKKLKESFPKVSWVNTSKEKICDYWLLVCGCQRGCVDSNVFAARQEVIKLYSPTDFEKTRQKIEKSLKDFSAVQKRVLHINDCAELTTEITESDIRAFTQLTMDHNKLHTEASFAAKHSFQRPVAQGMFSLSLLSAVMGTKLPGDGTVLMGCQSKFLTPVYPGDKLKAVIHLKKCRDFGSYYIAELYGECSNQKGETVTQMTAAQMLDKQFFQLEEHKKGEKL